MNTLSNFSDFALTRGEMKGISGGCAVYLPPGWTPSKSFSWSSTGSYTRRPDGSTVITGLSNSSADNFMYNSAGGRWCCSGCSSAKWL